MLIIIDEYLIVKYKKTKKTNMYLTDLLHRISKEINERKNISSETKIELAHLWCKKDPHLAIEIYESLKKEDPNNLNLWINLVAFYYENKDYHNAIDIVENKIINKEKGDYRILFLLGDMYEKIGDYKKAYQIYKETLKKWPLIVNPTTPFEKIENKRRKKLVSKVERMEKLIKK